MIAHDAQRHPLRKPPAEAPVLVAMSNEDYILRLQECMKRLEINNPLLALVDGRHTIDFLASIGFTRRGSCPIPCLILLSADLAEKNGFEVLEWIRKQKSILHILPVILLGKPPQQRDLLQARALGAHDYVTTTLTDEEMLEWVKEMKTSSLICGPLLSALFAQVRY